MAARVGRFNFTPFLGNADFSCRSFSSASRINEIQTQN